ncbi:DUF4444 domain-containing protein [Profundibacter sp.]
MTEENPFEAPQPVTFPPLFQGQEVEGATDPFDKACALAALGCDSGVLVYNISADRLRAAIVFAPEVPLEQAMSVFCTCGIGFQNALGALAPPEVAVHLGWTGELRVNGGVAGTLRAAASTNDPAAEPDWLVIGLTVDLIPPSEDDPGNQPDSTALYLEGCGDVSPIRLLESWARHTLVWINRLMEDGNQALHAEWRGLVHGMGEDVTIDYNGQTLTGTFLGVDEDFGMLIRDGETTHLVPLSSRLEGNQ